MNLKEALDASNDLRLRFGDRYVRIEALDDDGVKTGSSGNIYVTMHDCLRGDGSDGKETFFVTEEEAVLLRDFLLKWFPVKETP